MLDVDVAALLGAIASIIGVTDADDESVFRPSVIVSFMVKQE